MFKSKNKINTNKKSSFRFHKNLKTENSWWSEDKKVDFKYLNAWLKKKVCTLLFNDRRWNTCTDNKINCEKRRTVNSRVKPSSCQVSKTGSSWYSRDALTEIADKFPHTENISEKPLSENETNSRGDADRLIHAAAAETLHENNSVLLH